MKLITFKPLKPFFFGGEIGFSEDYFVKSKYFPQTTQLLGAIRLFILDKMNLLKVYKNGRYVRDYTKSKTSDDSIKKAIELVGDANDLERSDNLGKIKFLSPMFLLKDDNIFYPVPFDISKNKTLLEYDDDLGYLKGYDAKEGVFEGVGGINFWNAYINNDIDDSDLIAYEEIFEEVVKVGIAVDKKQNIEGKFYLKKSFLLKNDFLFGCFIDFDEEFEFKGILSLGADGSIFEVNEIEINHTNHPIYQAFIENKEFFKDKKVAISDVFYPENIKCEFRIIPYYNTFEVIDKDKGKFKGKKGGYRLYSRGSVFYKPSNLVKAKKGLNKISYNKFI